MDLSRILCDPFWDGEDLTLSKFVGDLQLGDQKGHFENHMVYNCIIDYMCIYVLFFGRVLPKHYKRG